MRLYVRVFCAILSVAFVAMPAPTIAEQRPVLTILHFNDDYQLSAVEGGKAGVSTVWPRW